MDHISSHFASKFGPQPKKSRKRLTERGELMRHFCDKLNLTRKRDGLDMISMARMGKILEAIPTNDLYYLKSVCDETARRGNDFSKRFWWEVDPKKHPELDPKLMQKPLQRASRKLPEKKASKPSPRTRG